MSGFADLSCCYFFVVDAKPDKIDSPSKITGRDYDPRLWRFFWSEYFSPINIIQTGSYIIITCEVVFNFEVVIKRQEAVIILACFGNSCWKKEAGKVVTRICWFHCIIIETTKFSWVRSGPFFPFAGKKEPTATGDLSYREFELPARWGADNQRPEAKWLPGPQRKFIINGVNSIGCETVGIRC